jgi:hypothetical protein
MGSCFFEIFRRNEMIIQMKGMKMRFLISKKEVIVYVVIVLTLIMLMASQMMATRLGADNILPSEITVAGSDFH